MPSKSSCPPRLPAPGPRSITWSAASIASGSCSTTTTVLPRSASRRRIAEQPPRVGGVQADRRLVEDVERAGQRAAERRGEADALRLAARERAGRRARASGSRGRRRSCSARATGAPRRPTTSRSSSAARARARRASAAARASDRSASSAIVLPRKRTQSAGGASRAPRQSGAERVGAVAREQHADVDLVALGLEPVEEAAGRRRSRRAPRSGPRARAPRGARPGMSVRTE